MVTLCTRSHSHTSTLCIFERCSRMTVAPSWISTACCFFTATAKCLHKSQHHTITITPSHHHAIMPTASCQHTITPSCPQRHTITSSLHRSERRFCLKKTSPPSLMYSGCGHHTTITLTQQSTHYIQSNPTNTATPLLQKIRL